MEKENLDEKKHLDKEIESEKTEEKEVIQQKETIEEKELSFEDKIKELEDKLTRSFAEMENQRRRYEKEKDDAFEYGGFSFAKEALNLLDNLERSRVSLESDENLKNSEALSKVMEHLNIINSDMISIFKKNNIEEIKSINMKLDPNLHQAMMEIEDDTKDPGTIVQEIQKGFMMKDRLLRPSLVGVSKKKAEKVTIKEEKNQEIDENSQKIILKCGCSCKINTYMSYKY